MTLSKTEEEEVKRDLMLNLSWPGGPLDEVSGIKLKEVIDCFVSLLNNRETELIEKIKMEIVDLINNRSIEHGERLGIAMCLKLPSLQAPKEEI